MALKQYTPEKLAQRVSPFTANGSIVNQLAWVEIVTLPETHDGFLHVSMRIKLIPYAYAPCPETSDLASWDTWGAVPESLDGSGPYSARNYTLVTDNDTYVEVTENPNDPNFGVLRAQLRYHGQDYIDYLCSDEYPGIVMPQSTFMSYVRDHCPSVMGDVLRYHLRAADAMGYFSHVGNSV